MSDVTPAPTPHTVLTDNEIHIYVDGACSGNPGPGGWGVLMLDKNKKEVAFWGSEAHTTNNRMELQAAIEALKRVEGGKKIILSTDSQYVKNGISLWIKGWKKKNWMNSQNQPVKNQDLWLILDDLCAPKDIEWRWVKGHSGDVYNEKVDLLAKKGIIALQMQ